MLRVDPLVMKARKRIFISRRSILAVKPGLIPVLWMVVVFGMREINFLPFLNWYAAKFSVGAVREFGSAV